MPPAAHPAPVETSPPPSPAVFELARALARQMAAQQFAADQRPEPIS